METYVNALMLTAVTLTYLPAHTHATKILLVPGNLDSHIMLFSRLAIDLAKLGNMATVIAPSNARIPDFVTDDAVDNFTYVKYPVDETTWFPSSAEMTELVVTMATTTSPLQIMRAFANGNAELTHAGEKDCVRLLDNVELMRQIRETRYDFAIMDLFGAIACYYTIPYSLGMPYATMSLDLSSAYLFRVPRLSSFPNAVSLSDRPSFLDRLTVFIIDRLDNGVISDNRHYMKKYAPDRPYLDTVELFQRQSLWFFVEDLSVHYPLPQMPNTIAVGDIIIGTKVRPLSGEIKEFVSRSKHGVILVAFGSWFSDVFPPAVIRRLCDAFIEAAKRFGLSFVWKLKGKVSCSNNNILILPWIPQIDLLADTRVRLFISHGGYNSIIESVYHAKPLILFPIGVDQPANAAAGESKGYAIQMKILDFSAESLVSNIHKLLTDPTYKRNANLASGILRDRRDTAAQRVSAMIDHVIKYGDRHLRTGAFELSTFQFMMFDIFAALVAAAVIVLSVVALLCCCLYRVCCSRRNYTREKSKSQ